jgi:hypothetical protein
MADDVVVIQLESDGGAEVERALDRLDELLQARGFGEVAGHMTGVGTTVFIDVAPALQSRVAEVVLPAVRALAAEVGLEGATVEIPAPADDDDWDDDEPEGDDWDAGDEAGDDGGAAEGWGSDDGGETGEGETDAGPAPEDDEGDE